MQWHLEKRNINDLKDHPKNPRQLSKHDAEHLQKSIDKFGLIDKPIINLDNQIIGGHQRKAILKKLKIKEIDCWVPDKELTQEQVDELNVRLNKNTGTFDFDILANEWNLDDLLEWGFTPEEFQIEEINEKEFDESITDDLTLIVKFNINIPNEDSTSFENQLDQLLSKFPRAKMEKKI